MKENRTTTVLKIIFSSNLVRIVTIAFSFINRTVFIYCLNADYLGLNGLFTSILSTLCLTELGIGAAITYRLYKPIELQDIKHIRQLTEFYKKCYRIIGCTVMVLGIAIVPFLKVLINVNTELPINLNIIYGLYLFNTVSSYLFFAYYQTVILAYQKQYIVDKYKIIFKVISSVLCCGFLLLTKNYYLYLLVQIICTLSENLIIRRQALKLFPFLDGTRGEKISKEERGEIKKDVFSLMVSRVSATLSNSFDTMIVSAFVSTSMVGLISNYTMIIGNVLGISNSLVTSATASVGNLVAEGDEKNLLKVFKELDFLNYYLMFFVTICFYVLIDPFITIWLGNSFIIDESIKLCFVFNMYITYSLNVVWMFKDGMGLFKYGRFAQLVQGITNIILSIVLCNYFDAAGVYAASFFTNCFIIWPIFNYYLFKMGLNQPFYKRVVEMIKRTGMMLGVLFVTKLLVDRFNYGTIYTFLFQMLICLIIPNLCFWLIYYKKQEFKALILRIKRIIKI